MTEPIDTKAAASELAAYVLEVLHPPAYGASLGAILGAYIFKAVLRDAGYAIVPLTPTPGMVSAFRRRWPGPFPTDTKRWLTRHGPTFRVARGRDDDDESAADAEI